MLDINYLKERILNKFTNRFSVLTENGFQHFDGIKKTKHTEYIEILFDDGSDFKCSVNHLIKQNDIFKEAQTLEIKSEIDGKFIVGLTKKTEDVELYDLLNVDNGNHYITSELTSHNCAFIRSTLWDEFSDSIFPAQSGLSWKKNIILSTANGMNHYYQMVQGAKKNENGMKLFEVDWKDVPRYKSDGSLYSNDEFKEAIIKKHGSVYFEQNYGCVASHSIINIKNKETGEILSVSIEEAERLFREQ